MVSLNVYAAGSAFLSALMIANAFAEHEQYYPSAVHLMTAKPSQLVLGNMAVVLTILFGRLVKTVFLGQLRAIEVEHVQDRARVTVFSTCLAMTFFRSEFGMRFMAFFTLLLFFKCFHWLCQDRVELVEQAQITTLSVHVRQIALMTMLAFADALAMYLCAYRIKEDGVSMLLLFLFEYTVLTAYILTTLVKYAMTLHDIAQDGRWDNKGLYVFYLDLVSDFVHLTVQFFFFATIMAFYGLPLHMIHQIYMTFNSFRRRVLDFYQYRRATGSMNTRYPEATAEELAAHDATCIICRDEMTSARKLPCGHLFHVRCLRSWLQQQQTCPTCRRSVLDEPAQPGAEAAAAAGGGGAGAGAGGVQQQAQQQAPQQGQQQQQQAQQQQQPPMQQHQAPVAGANASVDWQLALLQQQSAMLQAMIANTAAQQQMMQQQQHGFGPQSPSAGNATISQFQMMAPQQQALLAMQLQMQAMLAGAGVPGAAAGMPGAAAAAPMPTATPAMTTTTTTTTTTTASAPAAEAVPTLAHPPLYPPGRARAAAARHVEQDEAEAEASLGTATYPSVAAVDSSANDDGDAADPPVRVEDASGVDAPASPTTELRRRRLSRFGGDP